jgi:hypothetical protein
MAVKANQAVAFYTMLTVVDISEFGPAVAPSRPCERWIFRGPKCREVSFALPDHRPQRIGVEATAVIQLVHRPDVISLTRGRALRKGCNAAVIRDPLELVTLRQRVPSQSLKPGQD